MSNSPSTTAGDAARAIPGQPTPPDAAVAAPTQPAAWAKLSETLPKLRWTDVDGELVLAFDGTDDRLLGACGAVGRVNEKEVEVGKTRVQWSAVPRTGRRYALATFDLMVDVNDRGEVMIEQRGKKIAGGKVTGTDTEAGARWFAAFIVGAALVDLDLGLTSSDGSLALELHGPTDMKSWQVELDGQAMAKQVRGETAPTYRGVPAPDLDPKAVVVKPGAGGSLVVHVPEGKVYPDRHYTVIEDADGTLRIKPTSGKKPPVAFAKLRGRKKCKPHDVAVGVLVQTFVWSEAGAKLLRAGDTLAPR